MLISVIVPIYKVEKYIQRCVDSILMQSFDNFELVLVDDGSPDKCGSICDKYAQEDDRIFVIHRPNGGLSDARNAGIDWSFVCSESEWLTFIDSDDWVHFKYIECLYNAVIDTGCQVSVCAYQEMTGELLCESDLSINTEIVSTEVFFCKNNINAVVAWGKLYFKNLFRNIRYPIGKLHEDEYTTYQIIFLQPKLIYLSNPMYYYFNNIEGITKKQWTPERLSSIDAIKEQLLYFYLHKNLDAYRFSIEHLMVNIMMHLAYIKKLNSEDVARYYSERVKKDLRYTLKRARRFNMYPILEYPYYYEVAYPKKMKLFWIWNAILKKIRRM